MSSNKKLLLCPIKWVKLGDISYGANGLLYKVKRSAGVKKWSRVNTDDPISDAELEYKSKLVEVLKDYYKDLAYDIMLYHKYHTNSKSESNLNKINEVSKRIWDNTEYMFRKLIPKYHTVKNFGRGTFNFLDRGFAYYQLFRILKYYGLNFKLIGVKAQPRKRVNLSGEKHFKQVLNYLNDSMAPKFSTIKKVLSTDLKSKWEAGSKLNLVTRIHLMINLLKTNIKEKKSVPKSKIHCNKLIKIYNLLRKIKKVNVDGKSNKLDWYFKLYREAVLDIVNLINFYYKLIPEMHLGLFTGSVSNFHNNHVSGLSRAQFGYSLYYLISCGYVPENLLWDWTLCRWTST
jgi:hypothetical protein